MGIKEKFGRKGKKELRYEFELVKTLKTGRERAGWRDGIIELIKTVLKMF